MIAKLLISLCGFLSGVHAFQEPPRDDPPTLDELLGLPEASPRRDTPDAALEDDSTSEPFQLAVEGMRDAAQRLESAGDYSIETQRVQQQVVDRLDRLIAQARAQQQQQRQQSRSSDSGSQQQEQEQSQSDPSRGNPGEENGADASGAGPMKPVLENVDDRSLHALEEEWGKLPPRLRDALRNVMNEKFSSLYDEHTRRYYQRLAEESK